MKQLVTTFIIAALLLCGTAFTATVQTASASAIRPTLSTVTITDITDTSAKLTCTITNNGGSSITKAEFDYGKDSDGRPLQGTEAATISGSTFTTTLSGLSPGTKYAVEGYAWNSGFASAGGSGEKTFTTTVAGDTQTANWSGTVNLTSNVVKNITLTGHTTVNVASGLDIVVSGIISGPYTLTKTGGGILNLAANNTYTGLTTINMGSLHIGHVSTNAGSIAGNIAVNKNGYLFFARANYIYSGVISGEGCVVKIGSDKLTLKGANTYKGYTDIRAGTLILDGNGTIENSEYVTLSVANIIAKLDISAGNKTIKGLRSDYATAEVILGARMLTVGTSGGGDGGGTYAGKISGSGGITKTGSGALTLSGVNTATGQLLLAEGTLTLSSGWAGYLNQFPSTVLNVNGYVNIGKFIYLQGGTINMNLTTATPSKLIASDALMAIGKTKLNVRFANPGDRVLFIATNGGVSTTPFTLNSTGTLKATSTTLSFSTGAGAPGTADVTPPSVSNKTITAGTRMGTGKDIFVDISWTKATDNITPTNELDYIVSWRKVAEMTWTHNGLNSEYGYNNTGISNWQTAYLFNRDTYTISGLQENKEYEVKVEVRDKQGNSTSYKTIKVRTKVDFNRPVMCTVFTIARKNSIEVEWYKATDDRTAQDDIKYQVWCREQDDACGAWPDLKVSGVVSGTSYVFTGLESNTKYLISVHAIDEAGNVGKQNMYLYTKKNDNASPLISNPNITVGTRTEKSIAISWTKATDNKTKQSELRYGVLWNESEIDNYWYSSPLLKDASSYTIAERLKPDTKYSIIIEVYDKEGNFSEYNIVTTKTLPAKTKLLSGTMKKNITTGQAEAIDLKVWAYNGTIYISASEPGTAYIYHVNGTLVKTAEYSAGETTIPLPQGLYIVRTMYKVFKIVIK